MSYKSRTLYSTGLKKCLKGCKCKACQEKEKTNKPLIKKDKQWQSNVVQ